MTTSTITSISTSPCEHCDCKDTCNGICDALEAYLPSMEQGRVDSEDLPRIFQGQAATSEILKLQDTGLFTPEQETVVHLYYRESLLQREIGQILNITQQAVNDYLQRIRSKVGKHLIKVQKKSA